MASDSNNSKHNQNTSSIDIATMTKTPSNRIKTKQSSATKSKSTDLEPANHRPTSPAISNSGIDIHCDLESVSGENDDDHNNFVFSLDKPCSQFNMTDTGATANDSLGNTSYADEMVMQPSTSISDKIVDGRELSHLFHRSNSVSDSAEDVLLVNAGVKSDNDATNSDIVDPNGNVSSSTKLETNMSNVSLIRAIILDLETQPNTVMTIDATTNILRSVRFDPDPYNKSSEFCVDNDGKVLNVRILCMMKETVDKYGSLRYFEPKRVCFYLVSDRP